MLKLIRRGAVVAGAAATAVTLIASTASAHECYNTSWSAQAEQSIAAHSHGWFDIQTWQLMAIFAGSPCDPSQGECLPPVPGTEALATVSDPELLIGAILGFVDPSQVLTLDQQAALDNLVTFSQQVADVAASDGVPTHYLTLANATAAGGATNSPQNVTANGKGIDHFPDVYGDQLIGAFFTVYCGAWPDSPACA